MNTDFYFLSPVEVVRITKGNMKDVAHWCGGHVAQAKSKHQKDRMDDYVWVPVPEGAKISQAFPGMFVTKRLVISQKGELKATFSVFRRDYFEKNYWDTIEKAVDATWERAEREAKRVRRDISVTVDVGDALEKAMDKVRELEAKVEKLSRPEEQEVELTEVLPDMPSHVHSIAGAPTPMKMKGKIHKIAQSRSEPEHEDLSQQSPGEDDSDDAITG